jgi:hypothetical protein
VQSADCGKTERHCRNDDHHCYEEKFASHVVSVLITFAFPPKFWYQRWQHFICLQLILSNIYAAFQRAVSGGSSPDDWGQRHGGEQEATCSAPTCTKVRWA